MCLRNCSEINHGKPTFCDKSCCRTSVREPFFRPNARVPLHGSRQQVPLRPGIRRFERERIQSRRQQQTVKVFRITPDMRNAYFMPGCDPGEDYFQVNQQLFGTADPPAPPVATNKGFLANFTTNLARKTNPSF